MASGVCVAFGMLAYDQRGGRGLLQPGGAFGKGAHGRGATHIGEAEGWPAGEDHEAVIGEDGRGAGEQQAQQGGWRLRNAQRHHRPVRHGGGVGLGERAEHRGEAGWGDDAQTGWHAPFQEVGGGGPGRVGSVFGRGGLRHGAKVAAFGAGIKRVG